MVHLTFYWNTWAIFENEDIFRMIQREDYEGETWRKCCNECAKRWDWDDSYLVKGSQENLLETDRKLKEIVINENGVEVLAPDEVYFYYKNELDKLKEKVNEIK